MSHATADNSAQPFFESYIFCDSGAILVDVHQSRKRPGITPVLATIILIAITLIAGVAIAGFVFGLFGTLSNSPNVTVITNNLPHCVVNTPAATATLTWTCFGATTIVTSVSLTTVSGVACGSVAADAWIQFRNSGGGIGTIQSLTINVNGVIVTFTPNCPIAASGTVYVTFGSIVINGSPPNAGDGFTGTAVMTNGASVPFVGAFT